MRKLKINIKDIQLIVYDFDGVMTDNRVLVFQNEKEAVFCNRSDGLAISKIKKKKIPQIIISTEKNKVVKARAKKLRIPVLQSENDKEKLLKRYCQKKKISLNKVIYIGNDINDLEVMKIVGYPVAPCDASKEIKCIAKIITKKKGGEGVVRELLEYIE
ncbi:haloacid dehalogenase [Parcubacteria bacterium DG_74_2]|nr:MAG: haloacid dehalogenase [Parcubacteria bacterium DG_74_2]